MLVVSLRFFTGSVDHSVSVIGRCIDRVELERAAAGIDDVVPGACRDDYRKSSRDRCTNAVQNCLSGSLLDAKELIQRVDFSPDFFLACLASAHGYA